MLKAYIFIVISLTSIGFVLLMFSFPKTPEELNCKRKRQLRSWSEGVMFIGLILTWIYMLIPFYLALSYTR